MTERRKDLVEFEAQLREMKDPTIQLFLGMIDGMSPSAKDTALERQKKMMSIGEAMTRMLNNILNDRDGSALLREEVLKRNGKQE